MPEPDFEQLARRVVNRQNDQTLLSDVAEQLRQVWNARGEADMRELAEPVSAIVDAIRALDR